MAAVELPGLPREHLMRLAARSTLPLAPDGDNAAKVAARAMWLTDRLADARQLRASLRRLGLGNKQFCRLTGYRYLKFLRHMHTRKPTHIPDVLKRFVWLLERHPYLLSDLPQFPPSRPERSKPRWGHW